MDFQLCQGGVCTPFTNGTVPHSTPASSLSGGSCFVSAQYFQPLSDRMGLSFGALLIAVFWLLMVGAPARWVYDYVMGLAFRYGILAFQSTKQRVVVKVFLYILMLIPIIWFTVEGIVNLTYYSSISFPACGTKVRYEPSKAVVQDVALALFIQWLTCIFTYVSAWNMVFRPLYQFSLDEFINASVGDEDQNQLISKPSPTHRHAALFRLESELEPIGRYIISHED